MSTYTQSRPAVRCEHRYTADQVVNVPFTFDADDAEKQTWLLPVRDEHGVETNVRISACRPEEFEGEITAAQILNALVPMTDGVQFYYWHAPKRTVARRAGTLVG